jgi:hypothetical protein
MPKTIIDSAAKGVVPVLPLTVPAAKAPDTAPQPATAPAR